MAEKVCCWLCVQKFEAATSRRALYHHDLKILRAGVHRRWIAELVLFRRQSVLFVKQVSGGVSQLNMPWDGSTGNLWKKMGQPLTNCNTNIFNCFLRVPVKRGMRNSEWIPRSRGACHALHVTPRVLLGIFWFKYKGLVHCRCGLVVVWSWSRGSAVSWEALGQWFEYSTVAFFNFCCSFRTSFFFCGS